MAVVLQLEVMSTTGYPAVKADSRYKIYFKVIFLRDFSEEPSSIPGTIATDATVQ